MKLLLLPCLLFMIGCETAPATNTAAAASDQLQTNPEKFYMLDLPVEVNCEKGRKGCQKGAGTLVLEPQDEYQIIGRVSDDAKIVTIEDCTGEKVQYRKDERFSLVYSIPTNVRGKLCYLSVAAYAPKFRQAVALFDVRNVANPATARLDCNQTTRVSSGVEICQTKAGKLTALTFGEPMNVFPEPGCLPPVVGPDSISFSWTAQPPGRCWYKFLSKADEGPAKREFRMTVYSYDEYFLEGR